MKIINIIAIIKLKNQLDLDFLLCSIDGTERHPKVHWLKYRLQPYNTYIAFYKSGKILITGKSFEQLEQNKSKILALMEKHNICTNGYEFVIYNIVIVERFSTKLQLEKLIANLDFRKASYEPEQFPALIYKDWNVSFLIFSSGKVILTGAKSIEEAETAFLQMNKLIMNFQAL